MVIRLIVIFIDESPSYQLPKNVIEHSSDKVNSINEIIGDHHVRSIIKIYYRSNFVHSQVIAEEMGMQWDS
jgi:hypothetical protein